MSTLAEALKSKSSKHLSVIINAEGEPVTVEARNDEEQNIKLHEITDLLLAAGYFRARIKGLSSFDKVVGGMTWCIDSCDVDIDVDLLFQENLTIGQRISLTEKIVAVLPKLKCPHRIEPHQIQGLDFIHIFPVIQWLIKHSIERRKEMCESYKDYAVKQFNQQYTMTKIKESSKLRKKLICSINKIQVRNKEKI
uniref:CCDC93 N-terminal domain-containing protein n=1 Tax=Clastoptera arizonana TaxID=38151 RepID=A0A1B6BZX6_9HEMI